MKKTVLKERKCKNCGLKFMQQRPLQYLCGNSCAIKYGEKLANKKSISELRDMKAGLLNHKDYIQLLQKVVNTYVRMRDKEKGCVSCGVTLIGKKFDAGHFLPTTYQFLRFNEDNIHGQCVHCNQHRHGSQYEYAIGLEQRIGVDRMQWLHAHRHDRLTLSIPEIKEKIKEYKKKIAELK
jgi:hypothetical protein